MAMPVSGSLSICEAGLGTCRSIGTAVSTTTSGRLCLLGKCAGKTAPWGMRDFYGYNPYPVTALAYSCVGTQGVDALTYKYVCYPPKPMEAGTCYYMCLKGFVWPYCQPQFSYGYVRTYCNSTVIAYCCVLAPSAVITYFHGFYMCAGDTLCTLILSQTSDTACQSMTQVYTCIESVTNSLGGADYYKTPTIADYCVGSCSG